MMTMQNKMSKWKRFLLLAMLVLILVFLPLSWYKDQFSMTEARPFEVQADNPQHQLLIATQGSKYKDSVVAKLITQLKGKPIYIKVIDVSGLAAVEPEDWNAMVILHTWENWQPQIDAEQFIERLDTTELQKVVVLTTSGGGDAKMEGIDAITSASTISDVKTVAALINQRIQTVISK